MRKRFSAAMALALSCAMVLTACSGGSKPAETTAAAADTTAAAAETTAAAGDYVVSFIVSRYVDGKDWLQKKLHGKTEA